MDQVAVFIAASKQRYFWQHRRSGTTVRMPFFQNFGLNLQ
jgi:hypothetical protein